VYHSTLHVDGRLRAGTRIMSGVQAGRRVLTLCFHGGWSGRNDAVHGSTVQYTSRGGMRGRVVKVRSRCTQGAEWGSEVKCSSSVHAGRLALGGCIWQGSCWFGSNVHIQTKGVACSISRNSKLPVAIGGLQKWA
jgi:hypothetical protein